MNDETVSALTEDEGPFRYVHSTGFPELLEGLGASLFVSTYQAGKLVIFRSASGRMSMLPRTFERAMGLAVEQDRIALGTGYQIWLLRNDRILARQFSPAGRHDACYLPRTSHVTGDINVHEMAWCRGRALVCEHTVFLSLYPRS